MNTEKEIKSFIANITGTINTINLNGLEQLTDLLLKIYHDEKTVFTFGNGGSGNTASHFCGDLIKGISYGLEKRFKAICLNDNISTVTAIANDLSYEDIFVEQLKNFLNEGDLVIGFSGSGNSVNVVKAFEYAKAMGAVTVIFCGFKGGRIINIAHLAIHADIDNMEASEAVHLIITHCIKHILIKVLGG